MIQVNTIHDDSLLPENILLWTAHLRCRSF